jgi:hypothetical protein
LLSLPGKGRKISLQFLHSYLAVQRNFLWIFKFKQNRTHGSDRVGEDRAHMGTQTVQVDLHSFCREGSPKPEVN